jgi:hypothetical protein
MNLKRGECGTGQLFVSVLHGYDDLFRKLEISSHQEPTASGKFEFFDLMG